MMIVYEKLKIIIINIQMNIYSLWEKTSWKYNSLHFANTENTPRFIHFFGVMKGLNSEIIYLFKWKLLGNYIFSFIT